MRLFFSGLRKLVRRPATWVTFLLLLALVVVIDLAVGATVNSRIGTGAAAGQRVQAMKELLTFPAAYERMLDFVLRFGGLMAMIFGAAIAGSEWGWGTLKSAVARGESRIGYMLSLFASIGVYVAIGLVVAFGVAVAGAVAGANLAGISTTGLNDSATLGQLPELILKGWFALLEEAALGFAIATLARSQLAGIGVGIAFYFGESFAGLLLPDYVQYMPFAVANAAVSTGSSAGGALAAGAGNVAALPSDQALLMVGVWLVGALVVTSLFSRVAEIGG